MMLNRDFFVAHYANISNEFCEEICLLPYFLIKGYKQINFQVKYPLVKYPVKSMGNFKIQLNQIILQ